MPAEEEYEYENEGRTKRRIIGGSVALVFIGAITFFIAFADHTPSAPKPKEVTVVEIFIPPPPPITPPPPQIEPPPPPEKEQMVVQVPVDVIDEPPPVEAPPEDPGPDLSTGLVGDGSNGFRLTAGGDRGGVLRPIVCKGGGSRYGWYAAKVQNTISSVLRNNNNTRTATFTLNIKIWVDRSGRVTRAQLIGSTGRSDIDEIIRSQILTGLQLTDPPPADMPMPINLRMTARKP
jgi:hypothetical protein